MTRPGASSASLVEACVLTLWLGAALFFAAAVAPAAFGVLPEPALAGALVGRLLPVLFGAGMGVGLVVVGLELRAGAARSRLRTNAATLLFALCSVAQFVVGGQIDRLRTQAVQPIGTLAPGDPRRVAFGRLHALSVAALAAAMLAAAAGVAGARRAARGGDRGA